MTRIFVLNIFKHYSQSFFLIQEHLSLQEQKFTYVKDLHKASHMNIN